MIDMNMWVSLMINTRNCPLVTTCNVKKHGILIICSHYLRVFCVMACHFLSLIDNGYFD